MILNRCAILIPFLISIFGCESKTHVRLDGGNPPTFILTGSGNLTELFIYGPEPERVKNPSDTSNTLWQIRADNMPGELVERVGRVVYGVVPNGYKQLFPEHGDPPALIPGKYYKYRFVTGNAPGAIGYYTIREGLAVVVEGPSECIERRDGKVIPLECPKIIKGATGQGPRECFEIRANNQVIPIECPD